jgi:hypothetical protein
MGGNPITHGAGAVGGVDLIPVQLAQCRDLLSAESGDLSFFDPYQILQLIDSFIPIPTIKQVRQNETLEGQMPKNFGRVWLPLRHLPALLLSARL